MSKFLLIETSTALCSVALAEDGRVTAFRESAEPRAHAAIRKTNFCSALHNANARGKPT